MKTTLILILLFLANPKLQAAHYDDGLFRQKLTELRNKDRRGAKSLTESEKVILSAANKTGMISFKNCGGVGNAFLARIEGRDVVVTNTHLIFDNLNGTFKNKKCTRRQYLADGVYFPDASYVDSGQSTKDQSFVYKEVKLSSRGVLGFPTEGEIINPDGDWMVFFTLEQISDKTARDGRRRGFLKASKQYFFSNDRQSLDLIIIGLDPMFAATQTSETSSYQECRAEMNRDGFYYQCDTSAGSSGSMIGNYNLETQEIEFVGVHSSSGAGGRSHLNYLTYNYGVRPSGRGEQPLFD